MRKINEECGIFGVFSPEPCAVAQMAYYGLFALQHRGQESAGIVVNDDGLFRFYKNVGLVENVFTPDQMERLGCGSMAVGHVRYGTTGTNAQANAQPFVINHVKGHMAVAHNGNLVNSYELRRELELEGSIFHSTSDTEAILYIITKERLKAPSIEEAINRAMYRIKGAYSLVVMSPSKLIALRDPNGFRPLCYGRTADGTYVVASESCALDAVGTKLERNIEPGEIIVFEKNGIRTIRDHCQKEKPALCAFEYVYIARPDSVIDGRSVHAARLSAGAILAEEHPVEADVVIGVPDSGIDAAIGYSQRSGIPYEMGFLKNKYIGRTFISVGQKNREDKVRIKLNPIASVVAGKRIVLVDDSIVRGTTCRHIVRLLRQAGAKEIHMRLSSPPFVNPCYYGTDIDSRENLIACKHTIPEIAEIIGVDSLGYLSIEGLRRMAGGARECGGYCTACFDGRYPTEVPDKPQKNRFERKLSESEKEND